MRFTKCYSLENRQARLGVFDSLKKYYDMIKKYFSLGANSKKYLFHLFLSAILRSLSFLLIPFMAAENCRICNS